MIWVLAIILATLTACSNSDDHPILGVDKFMLDTPIEDYSMCQGNIEVVENTTICQVYYPGILYEQQEIYSIGLTFGYSNRLEQIIIHMVGEDSIVERLEDDFGSLKKTENNYHRHTNGVTFSYMINRQLVNSNGDSLPIHTIRVMLTDFTEWNEFKMSNNL